MHKKIILPILLYIFVPQQAIHAAQHVIFEVTNQTQADQQGVININPTCQVLIIDRPNGFTQNTQYLLAYLEQSLNNSIILENNEHILEKTYFNEKHRIRMLPDMVQWQRRHNNNQQAEINTISYNHIGNNNQNADLQHIQQINQNQFYGLFVVRVTNDRPIRLSSNCQVFINISTTSIDDGFSTYYLDQNTIKNDKKSTRIEISSSAIWSSININSLDSTAVLLNIKSKNGILLSISLLVAFFYLVVPRLKKFEKKTT